ncbi:MarR family winged helix-turn-helix transcriptional regulator [Ornithinimicrobium faecis]|uniref:MarR family transcriptional regulator n=1 Tax=Ornithinimicrobium faecis TaxID=2934158 RepID=A0ABY4YSG6_9MICO|nr:MULTISPECIES: MarR family transcriptional regulator [unclassified Ornithinimicrobium]USQ79536.1 MarR family transcriptional regulator [Ornithinimicrobium sp. HY1793]
MPAQPDPNSPESIVRLAHDLRIACMRVSRRVRFETTTGGVAPHQMSVIIRLAASSQTSGELAAIERVSAPSMSRTVGKLVELGLVERASDDEDGRVVRLSLTPAGQEQLDEHRARRDAWMTERLDGLTDEERELLSRASELLNRVVDQ